MTRLADPQRGKNRPRAKAAEAEAIDDGGPVELVAHHRGQQRLETRRAEPEGETAHQDAAQRVRLGAEARSEEHTSELQSLMRNSYAVFCLKKKKTQDNAIHKKLIPNHIKLHRKLKT